MSESLHELEAALADAQREYATAEDSYTFRRARYDEKPTDKRHGRMLVAFQQRTDAAVRYSTAYYALAQAKKADHPPLKEGLHTRVTDEDLATLRAEGQLFDVAMADAVDERDNPAAPIVEVEAPQVSAARMDEIRTKYAAETDLSTLYRARDAVMEKYERVSKRRSIVDGAPAALDLRWLAQLRVEYSIVLERIAELTVGTDAEDGGRHRADEVSGPTPEDIAHYDGMAEGYNDDFLQMEDDADDGETGENEERISGPGGVGYVETPEGHESRGTCTVCGTEVAWGSRCHDHPAAGPDAVPEPTTETPVVTLAPVNGEGRFVPIGTIADGPAEGATVYAAPPRFTRNSFGVGSPTDVPCPCTYCTDRREEGLPNAFPEADTELDERDEAEQEQGYTRNEQGAYEYDGPVGEQPEVPAWDGVTPAPGNSEWETAIRNMYGISEDTPIVAHREMWTTWDGRTQSRTSYKPGEQPEVPVIEPGDERRRAASARQETTVHTDDTNLPYLYPNEKWTGDIDQEPLQRDAYMTLTGGPDPRAPKEPRVIATRRLGERFQGLPVYVQDGLATDTVYVLPSQGSQEGAVLMGSDTFAALQSKMDEVRLPNPDVASASGLKAKLDQLRNVARSVKEGDNVDVTVTPKDESPAQPTVEEQAVIDAGKAAQAKVDRELTFGLFSAPLGTTVPWGYGYTEAFAKAGDVPSAPADHVTATLGDTVTVEPDEAAAHVKDFAADSFKMPPPRDFTVTGEIRDAQPAFFEKVFPNARVVIGSNGKVEITANSVDNAAKAADVPTTPEGKLLADAAQIIGHDRNDQYGNAEDSFGVIAEFWSTWLTARAGELVSTMAGEPHSVIVTAADVANMLGLMKKARTAVGGHKRDNYTDEIGYTALAQRCEEKGQGL